MAGSASVPQRQIPIVDDHPVARRGLAAPINREPDLVVCVQAASRREAIDAIAVAKPDLAIVDLSLPDDDGLDLVREVRTGPPVRRCRPFMRLSCIGGVPLLPALAAMSPGGR